MSDTTVSVRLPEDVYALLASLSESTNRRKDLLASEAIARFVQDEADIVSGVSKGMADVEAGRVVSHHQAMRQIREVLGRVAGAPKSE